MGWIASESVGQYSFLISTGLHELTDMDHKRLGYLLNDEHRSYCHLGTATRSELQRFADIHPHKVELEALHWKGMDYLWNWLHQQLLDFENLIRFTEWPISVPGSICESRGSRCDLMTVTHNLRLHFSVDPLFFAHP
jgi:hypothetical protein